MFGSEYPTFIDECFKVKYWDLSIQLSNKCFKVNDWDLSIQISKGWKNVCFGMKCKGFKEPRTMIRVTKVMCRCFKYLRLWARLNECMFMPLGGNEWTFYAIGQC